MAMRFNRGSVAVAVLVAVADEGVSHQDENAVNNVALP
jgi:hypothetical protein